MSQPISPVMLPVTSAPLRKPVLLSFTGLSKRKDGRESPLAEAAIEAAEDFSVHPFDAAARRSWCDMNEAFHATLVEASGLRPLASAYAQVNLVPLASPRATIFNIAEPALLHRQLTAAHEDHGRILAALIERQSTRAAALVCEHAYRSGENKRRNFPHIDMEAMVIETPGIALLRMPGAEAGSVQPPR